MIYGRQEAMEDLDQRRGGLEGYLAHHKAIKEQEKIELEEKAMQKPAGLRT